MCSVPGCQYKPKSVDWPRPLWPVLAAPCVPSLLLLLLLLLGEVAVAPEMDAAAASGVLSTVCSNGLSRSGASGGAGPLAILAVLGAAASVAEAC
jgi:hypothetical protein